jgi:hypothetical protein
LLKRPLNCNFNPLISENSPLKLNKILNTISNKILIKSTGLPTQTSFQKGDFAGVAGAGVGTTYSTATFDL